MATIFGAKEVPITSVDQIGFDDEYDEKILTAITKSGHYYDVKFGDGWCMGWPIKEGFPDPEVGDTIRCYGRGIGSPVRGIAVNGRVLYYESAEEHSAKTKYEFAKKRRNDAVRNWEKREEKQARVDALPEPLRQRMAEFVERDPQFLLKSDFDYELFIYEEAAKIAQHFQSEEAITEWAELKDWDEQERQMPNIGLGHSGNTFYSAVNFAKYLVREGAVPV